MGEHGDLLDLIRHRSRAPTLRAALDEARAFLALPAAPAAGGDSGDSYDATEAARRLWARCRAIDGTHAERYLRARGLARCRFAALRFHPELRYREGSSVRRLPALVAAVTGDDGAVTGVQRTWLDPRSPAKAGVAAPRKALGRVYGRAVRFGHPAAGASLLVGEGIETVLSVVTAVPEVTAAAALSAGSLGAFAPGSGVARLVIARDNDAEGERAAERLARRCARAGVAATVVVPEGGDFNDDLVALGRRNPPLRGSRRCSASREGRLARERAGRRKQEREHGPHRQSEARARRRRARRGARRPPNPVRESVRHRAATARASRSSRATAPSSGGASARARWRSPISLRSTAAPWPAGAGRGARATRRCSRAPRPGPPPSSPAHADGGVPRWDATEPTLTFERTAPDEVRIYRDGEYVRDIYKDEDILNPGTLPLPHLAVRGLAGMEAGHRARQARRDRSPLGGLPPALRMSAVGGMVSNRVRRRRLRGGRMGASLRDRASAAISAALRFPLQSLAPPVAALPARSACQERQRWWGSSPPDDSHCPTRAQCANPCGVLR